jgi:hypothetical protein
MTGKVAAHDVSTQQVMIVAFGYEREQFCAYYSIALHSNLC